MHVKFEYDADRLASDDRKFKKQDYVFLSVVMKTKTST